MPDRMLHARDLIGWIEDYTCSNDLAPGEVLTMIGAGACEMLVRQLGEKEAADTLRGLAYILDMDSPRPLMN